MDPVQPDRTDSSARVPSASPARHGFRIHPVLSAAMVVGMLVGAGFGVANGAMENPELAAKVALGLGRMALIAVAVAWVVYRVGGRSQRAGNVALALAIAGLTAATVVSAREAAALRGLAAEAKDADRRLSEAAARLIALQEATALELQARTQALWDAGGIDVRTLRSPEEVWERLRLLRQCAAAEAQLGQLLTEPDIAGRLRAADVAESQVEGFLRGLRATGRIETHAKLRENQRQAYAVCDELLTIYADHFGRWSYSEEDGLVFADDIDGATLDRQGFLIDRITALAEEETELNKELAARGG